MSLSSCEYAWLVTTLIVITAGSASLVALLTHLHTRLGPQTRRKLLWSLVLIYGVAIGINVESLLLGNFLVVAVAVVGGSKIGSMFSTRSALVSGSVAASIADIVSFTIGPTRWLFDGVDLENWGRINYLMVSIPWSDRLLPIVGVGDLLFVAVFYYALRNLGIRASLAWGAPLLGLLVALGVGLRFAGAFGIPFMTAAALMCLLVRDGEDGSTPGTVGDLRPADRETGRVAR